MQVRLGILLIVLITGCQPHLTTPDSPRHELLEPPCTTPAPVYGQFDAAAPGFIVVFEDTIDGAEETHRLSALYGFQPRFVYTHALQGFSAELTPTALAGIRCEPPVRYASFNGRVSLD
jgi:hypothetical protein